MPQLGRFVPLALIALLVLAAPQLVRYYTDWLWFGEVGFRQVFGTILRTQSLLFLFGFVGALIWFAINVRIAVATMVPSRAPMKAASTMASSTSGRCVERDSVN